MIDLGKKDEVCCSCPPTPTKAEEPSISYPGVWLTFRGEDPDIPESGTITFSFRRTGKTVRTKKGDTPGCIEYDLELRSIDSMRAEGKKSKSASEALDDLVKEVEED